ncbi:MAG: pimeloyl-ACP methyl ester carboxylesterase [Flavobacteriaceae bacterium]|jgi:pimeloyl-ACP methyl ester carboxylesterase
MKVALENIELHYEEILPDKLDSSSTILLFLHEALGSIPQWKKFPETLCSALSLKGIVYERQGHGGSSKFTEKRSATYLHDYALQELPSFINATFPADQTFILVGHSDGGSIALLYANHYPDRVLGLITMAAHVINEPETIKGIYPAVAAYKAGKLNGLKKYHGDKTNDLFYAWANIWRDSSFSDWDISSEIGGSMPSIFMQGADDQYGTVKQLEIIQSKHSYAEIHLIHNCGHHPHLEQSEVVIQQIYAWRVSKFNSNGIKNQ